MKKYFLLLLVAFSFLSFAGCQPENDSVPKKEYTVSSEFFTIDDFSTSVKTTISVQAGAKKQQHVVNVDVMCAVSLISYNVNAHFYDGEGTLLDSSTIEKKNSRDANEIFTVSFDVSEECYDKISSVSILCSGVSYESAENKQPFSESTLSKHTVLLYVNDQYYGRDLVKHGDKISAKEPSKNNLVFDGWFTDKNCTQKVESIESNLTVYAGFCIDKNAIRSTFDTQNKKSVVSVGYVSGNSWNGKGTGVILNISNNWCYVLTTYSTVSEISKKGAYKIADYQGNVYSAQIYKNPKKAYKASDKNYNLAILCFQVSSQTSLIATRYAHASPQDSIFTVTYDQYGTSLKFGAINSLSPTSIAANNLSAPSFSVLHHNIIPNNVKVCPIFDSDLKLVGINYESNSNTNESVAIPTSVVLDFWDEFCSD